MDINKTLKEVVVEIIKIADTNKHGVPYTTKTNKKFWRVSAKFAGDDNWYSTTAWRDDDSIMRVKTGDKLDVMTWKSGDFLNFEIPSKTTLLDIRVTTLENKVFALENGPTIGLKVATQPASVAPVEDPEMASLAAMADQQEPVEPEMKF